MMHYIIISIGQMTSCGRGNDQNDIIFKSETEISSWETTYRPTCIDPRTLKIVPCTFLTTFMLNTFYY